MKDKLRKTLLVICVVVFLCCLGGLGYYFVGRYLENQTAQKVSELVSAVTPAPTAEPTETPEVTPEPTATPVLPKYAELYAQNNEAVGWLSIEDTNIDYVVMQSPNDPEKYLHLDYFGKESVLGSLFLDYRDDIWSSDNLIIYGHHMQDGSMFGRLESFNNEAYWQEHRYITFDTIYREQTFEIVAAFYARVIPRGEEGFRYYHFIEADSEAEFNEFKDFVVENRRYDTGVDFEFGDQLLTLSTCAYHVKNGRFAVVAKLVDPEPDRDLMTSPKPKATVITTAEPEDPLTELTEESPALAAYPEEDVRGQEGFSTDMILLAMLLICCGVAVIAILRLPKRG